MTIRSSRLSLTSSAEYSELGAISVDLSDAASGSSQDGGVINGVLDSNIYSIISSNTTNTFDGGTIS